MDYDNNGWADLFVVNGHVHDNIEDYDQLVTYAQRPQLFRNVNGKFTERDARDSDALSGKLVGRGALCADYDSDGDIDLAVASSGRRFTLFRNDGGNENNWLSVSLNGTF